MFVDLPGEEWRPVVGYEGRYEVSNLGRVRSFALAGKGHGRAAEPRLLNPILWRNGYLVINLCHEVTGDRHPRTVHALVMEAFVGPRPSGMEVRHLDGDRRNPALSNLAYGSHVENEEDRRRHGTVLEAERHPHASLTNEIVRAIRARRAGGEKLRVLAAEFGVSETTVSRACRGRTYGAVNDGRIEVGG